LSAGRKRSKKKREGKVVRGLLLGWWLAGPPAWPSWAAALFFVLFLFFCFVISLEFEFKTVWIWILPTL
jgi:hypothetical protein